MTPAPFPKERLLRLAAAAAAALAIGAAGCGGDDNDDDRGADERAAFQSQVNGMCAALTQTAQRDAAGALKEYEKRLEQKKLKRTKSQQERDRTAILLFAFGRATEAQQKRMAEVKAPAALVGRVEAAWRRRARAACTSWARARCGRACRRSPSTTSRRPSARASRSSR